MTKGEQAVRLVRKGLSQAEAARWVGCSCERVWQACNAAGIGGMTQAGREAIRRAASANRQRAAQYRQDMRDLDDPRWRAVVAVSEGMSFLDAGRLHGLSRHAVAGAVRRAKKAGEFPAMKSSTTTKAARIMALGAEGKTTREIADDVWCDPAYVRVVLRQRKGTSQSDTDKRYTRSPLGQAMRARAAQRRTAAGDRDAARSAARSAYRAARLAGASVREAAGKAGSAYSCALDRTGTAALRARAVSASAP